MATNVTQMEAEAVKGILKDHVGKDEPITSAEISERLGNLDDHDSNPNTRAIIRYLACEEFMPIGSCSQGYYIIDCESELDEYNDNLLSREEKIRERRVVTTRAFYKNQQA